MTEPKSNPCPQCQQLNPPDARFCDHCGSALPSGEQSRPAASDPASSHTITTVDASSGGVVAIGQGAKAVKVEGGSTYIETQTFRQEHPAAPVQKEPPLPPSERTCPECGKPAAAESAFCTNCDAKL
jgi:predicted amidophosphoribosyltransferase